MPKPARTCRCITLHTYPASVTHDAWHIATHVCHCGRVHFEEPIPVLRKAPRRRVNRRPQPPRIG